MPVLIREYLSVFHICAAAEFARQSQAYEVSGESWPKIQFPHYAAVIASLSESASFLESTINELLQTLRSESRAAFSS